MSYISQRPQKNRSAAIPRALGDLVDDLLTGATGGIQNQADTACNAAASVDPSVKARDAQIADLEQNWNPTGFYTADQLGQALSFTMQLTSTVTDAIGKAIMAPELDRHRARLQDALDSVQRSIGVGGLGVDPLGPYSAAVANTRATAGGDGVIEAPGFKRTVLNVMTKVRNSTEVLVAVSCARPSMMFDVIAKIGSAFSTLYDFLKAIVNFVVDAARVVAKIPDTLGTFFKYAKWAALLGGAYFIAVKAGVVPPAYDPLRLRE